MKLLRYGPPGQERPGLLDAAGNIRDLSGLLDDFCPRTLSPEALAVLRALSVVGVMSLFVLLILPAARPLPATTDDGEPSPTS